MSTQPDPAAQLATLRTLRAAVTDPAQSAPPSLLERLKAGGGLGGLKEYHLRNVLEELAYRAHQSAQSPDGRGLLERGAVREALITLFKQFDLGRGRRTKRPSWCWSTWSRRAGCCSTKAATATGCRT